MSNCCVPGCRRVKTRNGDKSFHKFPFGQPRLLQKWVTQIGRENFIPTKRDMICSDHFEKSDIVRSGNNAYLNNTSFPKYTTTRSRSVRKRRDNLNMVNIVKPVMKQVLSQMMNHGKKKTVISLQRQLNIEIREYKKINVELKKAQHGIARLESRLKIIEHRIRTDNASNKFVSNSTSSLQINCSNDMIVKDEIIEPNPNLIKIEAVDIKKERDDEYPHTIRTDNVCSATELKVEIKEEVTDNDTEDPLLF